MENHTKTPRLRAAIGTPDGDGDGVVSSAFETTPAGFIAVVPVLEREALDTELARLAADLPAGSALEAQIQGGDAVIVGSGFGDLPPLERAALAETLVDEVLTHLKGGAQ